MQTRKLWMLCLKLLGLNMLLVMLTGNLILAQVVPAVVDKIDLLPRQNDTDALQISGNDFSLADPLIVQKLDYNIGNISSDYQWVVIVPNADLSQTLKSRLNISSDVIANQGSNVIERLNVSVVPVQSFGSLKPSVQIKIKIYDQYFADTPKFKPYEEVSYQNFKEIIFRRDLLDRDAQFLTKKIYEASNVSTDDSDSQAQFDKLIVSGELGVPVLRLNIIGMDGARTISKSRAVKLAVFLNQDQREQVNKRFGIQFFVNNVSIDPKNKISKTIIFYRTEPNVAKQRFLKEALYLAKVIPSESIIKPMIDQNQKVNVDIEIYVGTSLN